MCGPQYSARTITHAGGVTTVGYFGGPFIIAASDAPTFAKLLQGTLVAKDVYGNAIDFSAFRANKGACTFGSPHWVNIHRAQVAFTAPAGKDFTSTPPRLALLATDKSNNTGAIFDGILEDYSGTPASTTAARRAAHPAARTSARRSVPAAGARGQNRRHLRRSRPIDKNNLQAATDATGNRLYRMVWMPHWESTATNTIAPNATESAALTNLSTFLDQPGGVMAECASISTLEGAYVHGSLGGCPGGASNYTSCANRASTTQYQTCVDNGSGACQTGATPWGMNRDFKGYGSSLRDDQELLGSDDDHRLELRLLHLPRRSVLAGRRLRVEREGYARGGTVTASSPTSGRTTRPARCTGPA